MKKLRGALAAVLVFTLTIIMLPAKSFASSTPLIITKLKTLGTSQQVVMVTTSSLNTSIAKIQTFEKINGVWRQVISPTSAVIGKNGFSLKKVEGDGKSPVGKFTFGTGFGKNSNPGLKVPYRKVTSNDYWVDDVNSAYYNTWQVGPAKGRWNSAEKLLRSDWLYNYAMVINYNTNPIVKGKGSAIFLHEWRNCTSGTAGCTATDEKTLLSIMRWLNPAKKPLIIQGPTSEVLKM